MSVQKYSDVFKPAQKVPFVVLPNSVVQNFTNGDAFLVWAYLQSLPCEWVINKPHLKTHFKFSDKKIDKILSLLKKMKLIDYIRPRGDDGVYQKGYWQALAGNDFIPAEKISITEQSTTPNNHYPQNRPEWSKGVHINTIDNNKINTNINISCSSDDERAINEQNDIKNEKVEETFKRVWEKYPKKQNKVQAQKSWNKLAKSTDIEKLADKLIDDIENRIKNDRQWHSAQYIPMLSTYLNNKRWDDEVSDKDFGNDTRIAPRMTETQRRQKAITKMLRDAYNDTDQNSINKISSGIIIDGEKE